MTALKRSGQAPFEFVHRADLSTLPAQVQPCEVNLHGGFAVDERPGFGHIYYAMPGCGLMRVEPTLTQQELIKLPPSLTPLNFHSTRLGTFEGKQRLFLPANGDEMVAILTLEGEIDFLLSRPEFDTYLDPAAPFKPTDAVLAGERLFVADGYGSNHILSAEMASQQWSGIFGGKTADPNENGAFGTAHGITLEPFDQHLAIADRLHSRIQLHQHDGAFVDSHPVPAGAWPCGIHYFQVNGRWLAVVGCLYDPVRTRPAPIYILDAASYELLATIRPKEELGVALADHLHNVIAYESEGQLFLICQAWNPGHYFVLQQS